MTLNVHHLLFALLGTCFAVNYKRYENYSSLDFDNTAGTFVPALSDCLAQSNASPLANGIVYNDVLHVCKLLTAYNNEILVNLHANAGWVTFVKDISDQTRIVYKAQASQSSTQDVYKSFLNITGSVFTTQFTAAVASLDKTTGCNCSYRNAFVDNWNASQVTFQFIKDGIVVASLSFRSVNINNVVWFAQPNLIASAPYSASNLRSTNFRSFSANGAGYSRSFAMWHIENQCPGDYYVLFATSEAVCPYSPSPYPNFLYSATATSVKAASAATQYADFMVISVTIGSRVIGAP